MPLLKRDGDAPKMRKIPLNHRKIGRLNTLALLLLAFCLILSRHGLAAPPLEPAASGKTTDLGELREWLNRRNVERKQIGLPGADILPKHHSPASHSRKRGNKAIPDEQTPPTIAATPPGEPVLHLGRGPDGRIHVRYIVKEEGPDQMQVYTPSGYSNPKPTEEKAKLERLTPRGRKVWLSGSSLRSPSSYEQQSDEEQ